MSAINKVFEMYDNGMINYVTACNNIVNIILVALDNQEITNNDADMLISISIAYL